MASPQTSSAFIALTVLVGSALLGCTAIDTSDASAPTPTASAQEPATESDGAPSAGLLGGNGPQAAGPNDNYAERTGDYSYISRVCDGAEPGTDRGQTAPGAAGTVEATNSEGLATRYRVASNDSYKAILERFCVDYEVFDRLNGIKNVGEIYADSVVVLRD